MKRLLARIYLRAFGWEADPHVPEVARCVVIAAPHTSNWDGPHMIAISWALGLKINWMGKHTLFKPPFGWLMRRFGGIAIDRRSPQGIVGAIADTFAGRERLWLAVPPEGTRARVDYWKSGFYAIAHEAQVPVVLGYLDFARKRGGLGPALEMSGDVRADMDRIRTFYAGMRGQHPERMGPMRLRAEEAGVWPPDPTPRSPEADAREA